MGRLLSPDTVRELRRALRRRRRMLTLLLILAIGAMVLPAFAPASSRTVPVVVAAHDLRAGALLAAGDLDVSEVPAALAPAGAPADPTEAEGRRLVTAVPAGGAVAASFLRDADDPGTATGRDVLAVPVDAALIPYLTAGTPVRLLVSAADPTLTRTVVATVVETPVAAERSGITAAEAAGATATVLLAVDPLDSAVTAQGTREGWVVVAVIR